MIECTSDVMACTLLTDSILSTMQLAVLMPSSAVHPVAHGASASASAMAAADEVRRVEAAKQRVSALLERIARRQHYRCIASATCTRRCSELELLQFADRIAQLANQQPLDIPVSASASPTPLGATVASASTSATITTDDFVLSVLSSTSTTDTYSYRTPTECHRW